MIFPLSLRNSRWLISFDTVGQGYRLCSETATQVQAMRSGRKPGWCGLRVGLVVLAQGLS